MLLFEFKDSRDANADNHPADVSADWCDVPDQQEKARTESLLRRLTFEPVSRQIHVHNAVASCSKTLLRRVLNF